MYFGGLLEYRGGLRNHQIVLLVTILAVFRLDLVGCRLQNLQFCPNIKELFVAQIIMWDLRLVELWRKSCSSHYHFCSQALQKYQNTVEPMTVNCLQRVFLLCLRAKVKVRIRRWVILACLVEEDCYPTLKSCKTSLSLIYF